MVWSHLTPSVQHPSLQTRDGSESRAVGAAAPCCGSRLARHTSRWGPCPACWPPSHACWGGLAVSTELILLSDVATSTGDRIEPYEMHLMVWVLFPPAWNCCPLGVPLSGPEACATYGPMPEAVWSPLEKREHLTSAEVCWPGQLRTAVRDGALWVQGSGRPQLHTTDLSLCIASFSIGVSPAPHSLVIVQLLEWAKPLVWLKGAILKRRLRCAPSGLSYCKV